MTVLVCANRGVGAKIAFSLWVLKWGDQVIRDGLHGKIHNNINELLINKLSLQDMGTYICLGESGIEGIHANKSHNASANLKDKGVPIILCENTIFHEKIGQPVSISIQCYSDPAVERFSVQTNGTAITSTVRINTHLLNESIDYLAFGKTVKLEAQALQFIILNSSQKNTEILAAMTILLFAGLAILVAFCFGLTITVFLIKRRIRRKQGKQPRESSGHGIEMNTVSVNSVISSEVTGGQEYRRDRTTDSNYYAYISDVRVDHRASQDIRPAENFAYDVLHTNGNSQDQSYSSLNPIDSIRLA
ncbi:hypothetical protein CHS0354_016965 [Potamilus streckersoni]|uniref:Ig-like domain-containing protein n=1 Tax=Potamilus streckersoni TaxID=2493646 RepID=A0AAE0S7I2_9BIVA|nr:hypothetical protein CHS0354_016965 [Potamilus streckersoni]